MPRFTVKRLLAVTVLVAITLWCVRDVSEVNRNKQKQTKAATRSTTKAVDELAEQAGEPTGSPAKNVRRIPIPQAEYGYKHFESRVVTTKDEFESFLNDVTQQPHWNHKDDFLSALRDATIDFQTDVLLLIRTTAGSGSIKISLEEPAIAGTDIVFRVVWKMPNLTTQDMNYECFAVTIPKKAAKDARIVTVLVRVPDGSRGRDFTIAPQVIPLSRDLTSK